MRRILFLVLIRRLAPADSIQAGSPNRYWDVLEPDHEVSAKVRIPIGLKSWRVFVRVLTRKKSSDFFAVRHPIAEQRRVYDMGYIRSLNEPNVELIADDAVVRAEGDKVYTRGGRELRADVVVLATGFKVRDCEFPRPL